MKNSGISRRTLLKTSATVPLLGVGWTSTEASEKTIPSAPNRLFVLGASGWRFSDAGYKSGSVLTSIHLASQHIRQCHIPLHNGHAVLESPLKHIWCISRGDQNLCVLKQDLSVHKMLKAPDNYMFSGHGVIDSRRGVIWLSAQKSPTRSKSDSGRILGYDIESLQLQQLLDSNGLNPHDLALSSTSDHLIVSHYGTLDSQSPSLFYTFETYEPKLTILNLESKKDAKHIVYAKNMALTHLSMADDDRVFAVPLQQKPIRLQGERKIEKSSMDSTYISLAEERVGLLGLPAPIVEFNLNTATYAEHAQNMSLQRRPQSIVYFSPTNSVYVTYPDTGTLACLNCGSGEIKFISEFELGLSGIRGICTLGDRIVVAAEERGLAVLSTPDHKVVSKLNVPLYMATHITAV